MVTSMLTGVVWTFGACHTFFIVLPFGSGPPAGYRLVTHRDRSLRPATFGRHRQPLWRRQVAGNGRSAEQDARLAERPPPAPGDPDADRQPGQQGLAVEAAGADAVGTGRPRRGSRRLGLERLDLLGPHEPA